MTKKLETEQLLKIGDVAKQSGVSITNIRYYESLDLLSPAVRSENGYRYYESDVIEHLQFIKKAQALDFSLAEIKQILDTQQHGEPVCGKVRLLLAEKIQTVSQRLEQLATFKLELENYQNRWRSQPSNSSPSTGLCSLITEVSVVNNKLTNHQSLANFPLVIRQQLEHSDDYQI